MIKQYLEIIKPWIILSNLISVMGGFLLASKGIINFYLFFKTILGVLFIIASSCIFNNYIDCDIDRKMRRTENRVLVKKIISTKTSLIFAFILGVISFILLKGNWLVIWLATTGFVVYVGLYSLYLKRKTIYSTLIGSISGAIPPVIGYCSVSHKFDLAALILLITFITWQMPHFYAIAILHFKDYKIASIPVLPVKKGILITKHYIIFYIICFILAASMLVVKNYVGYKYFIVMFIVNFWWLYVAFQGYKYNVKNNIWAKKVFIISIVTIILLNIMISLDFKIKN